MPVFHIVKAAKKEVLRLLDSSDEATALFMRILLLPWKAAFL